MITILMPIYNGIEFIDESVSSILKQTYDKWELIIGINGHPQNSDVYKIAKSYEDKSIKIKVFDLFDIKGKSNALNKMISLSNYNHIALLDVDDIWYENKLEIQVKLLDMYNVIGSQCIYIGNKNGTIPKIPINDITNASFNINPIINSSCIIQKELCKWDNEWDGVEDYDLWLRLKLQNKTFYNCSEILVKHRIHNSSAFNSKNNNKTSINLLKKYNIK
jgi:teichuronic acid biosynthesis glycosyltransferase TuaG